MSKKRSGIFFSIISLFIGLIYLAPIYVMINVSQLSPSESRSYWALPKQFLADNFRTAFVDGKIAQALMNTSIITIGAVTLIVLCGAFAAYPLARRRTKLNNGIRSFVLGIMMVPPLSILVSLYSILVDIKAVNTYWGLILVLVTFELPLSIFLYTNFIASIPRALDEAAMIDGCGPLRCFFSIIMPQLKPVTTSVIILAGVHCWNDYQFSLYVMQSVGRRTIPLSIASFFSQTTNNLNAATAGALIAILPIIVAFLFLQKYFIRGMVDSAVK